MNNGLYSVTIKDIPQDERPIERLIACGPEALSTAEIMAIVIRCGTRGENVVDLASRLLNSCGSMKNLACADFAELASVKGIGRVKAAQLKAAIELGKGCFFFRRDTSFCRTPLCARAKSLFRIRPRNG